MKAHTHTQTNKANKKTIKKRKGRKQNKEKKRKGEELILESVIICVFEKIIDLGDRVGATVHHNSIIIDEKC